MKRLTKQWGKDNENCVAIELDYLCLVGLDEHEFLAFDKIVRKLAYYEDLEDRISSICEDITIEMIVGEIEVEYNKSIENILNLCKKLKEME